MSIHNQFNQTVLPPSQTSKLTGLLTYIRPVLACVMVGPTDTGPRLIDASQTIIGIRSHWTAQAVGSGGGVGEKKKASSDSHTRDKSLQLSGRNKGQQCEREIVRVRRREGEGDEGRERGEEELETDIEGSERREI